MSSSTARNIATEGRSLPSLRQLDEAVRAFLAEHPADQLTVVVDATFGHRIDAVRARRVRGRRRSPASSSRRRPAPSAEATRSSCRSPTAPTPSCCRTTRSRSSTASTRGCSTRVASSAASRCPGVGWVFLLRTPVRGPASRRSVKEATIRAAEARRHAAIADVRRAARATRRRPRPEPRPESGDEAAAGRRPPRPRRSGLRERPSASKRGRERRPSGKPALTGQRPAGLHRVRRQPPGRHRGRGHRRQFASHGAYVAIGATSAATSR